MLDPVFSLLIEGGGEDFFGAGLVANCDAGVVAGFESEDQDPETKTACRASDEDCTSCHARFDEFAAC
jgi:hypothetical protein